MANDLEIETHLSRVTLRGDRALKRLKPVRYPFVDFSTLAKREAGCRAEVAHNGPWAPGIYLGVHPLAGDPPVLDGPGEPVDWAVEMVRLPDDARLSDRIDTLGPDALERVGRHLRSVHDTLPARPEAALPEVVERRILENLDELLAFALPVPSARLTAAVHGALERARPALAARSGAGRVFHGDLRTDHVYLLADAPTVPAGARDAGIVVLDGVAFDPAFAQGDPVEDVAFLAMELAAKHGRWDLEHALWRGWSGGMPVDPALVALYTGHRSLIRAKVRAIGGDTARVRMHVVHALVRMEPDPPLLVGIGGLPGVGKSVLARSLADRTGAVVLRTDAVRKQLDAAPSYDPAARDAVYEHVYAAAAERLGRGERVVIDASFGRDPWRRRMLQVAREHGVPAVFLFAHAERDVVAGRLAARTNDPSDADLAVHDAAAAAWEPESPAVRERSAHIDTSGSPEQAVRQALSALRSTFGADRGAAPPLSRSAP
ncbi:MAG: AAA family ATPase [Myxococcota bacterium]